MSSAASVAATPDPAAAIQAEIKRLGLESYSKTLDDQGFVVIPPEIGDPTGLAPKMLESTLDVIERRTGIRPDLDGGKTHASVQNFAAKEGGDSPFGEMIKSLLHEGRVFEEALMNPVVLALVTQLCGYSVILSGYAGLVKGPNKSDFFFHADTLLPPPWPTHSLVCNATYVLTDYDLENGATTFLPGSHKLGRAPRPDEINVAENPDTVVIEATPGSIIVWHGATWHGAYHRTKPGLRISNTILFARPYMRTEEDLSRSISQEILDRNSTRFAYLTHQAMPYGWESHEDSLVRNPKAYDNLAKFHEEMDGLPAASPMAYEHDLING